MRGVGTPRPSTRNPWRGVHPSSLRPAPKWSLLSLSTSGPGLSDGAEPRWRDLGIDGRGVETPVPQDVGNLLQGRATLEHPGGRTVTQAVRAMQSARETAASRRLPDDRPDHGGVDGNIQWSTVPDKDGTALGLWPTFAEIIGDGLTRDNRERQYVSALRLAHADRHRSVLPIDVFEVQGRYLTRTQTEIDQAANDGAELGREGE